ncbi:MAG: hypothetical protein OXQ29_26400 [Rhodospirillaceae bacterium]|nr:hypothetical protein [Rhodospirillaceae bacterium]
MSLSLPPFAFANAWLPPCSCAEHQMHRHRASPLRRHTAVHQCGGSAAALPLTQPARSIFLFRQDDDLPPIPVMLPTIISVQPITLLFLCASLRDRAGLRSPLRGLRPSADHPSPLRSLTLAARPLPGGSLRSPPVAWPPPRCPASA